MKTTPQDRFQTIRHAAKLPDLPTETAIRDMVKRGMVPGFYAGKRFYVNVPAFRDRLEALSNVPEV